MAKHWIWVLLAGCMVALSWPLQAKEAAARSMVMPAGDCEMKENITLGISFNRKVASFAEAKDLFEGQMKKLDEMAKQQELKKFVLQNQNYNIYSQPQGYAPDGTTPIAFTYQMSGNLSYVMDNADAAFRFAEMLTQQKWQVNVNSNAHRQGNCER